MAKTVVGELALRYDKMPLTKALFSLLPLPGLGAVDVLVQARLDEYRHERALEFFDELAAGEMVLTTDLIQSEDFLHAYFCTAKAAMNERRREKIRLFAKLLTSSVSGGVLPDLDEYEKYLKILDDLEPREMQILLLLDELTEKHGRENISGGEGWLDRFHGFSKEFSSELETRLGVRISERSSVIMRLARTGCLQIFIPTTSGASRVAALLSPTYYKLKDAVELGKINKLGTPYNYST